MHPGTLAVIACRRIEEFGHHGSHTDRALGKGCKEADRVWREGAAAQDQAQYPAKA